MKLLKLPKSLPLLGLIFTMGCINPFAPSLTDNPGAQNQILTEQKTPEDVLINFSYAYNFKDSLVYSDLLDSSFLFISKNFATDPVTNISWGRDVDIKTTVGLFHHFQTLNLVWEATVYSRFLNEERTQKEIKKSFKLTLDGGIEFPPISGEALFLFRKRIINPPDTSGIWKITRWEDLSRF